MNRETRKLLVDILDSGQSIRGWCEKRSFAEYETDRQFRRAVEREFEIIGEALGRLSRTDGTVAQRITELQRVVAFRNRIIHGYDSVDDAIVWGIVQGHLPLLLVEVETLLDESSA